MQEPAFVAFSAQTRERIGQSIARHRERRRLLADRAFATPAGTRALTAVTQPEILSRIEQRLQAAESAGADFAFVDGAVIVGTPFEARCDALILVTAPYETSVARICARDGIAPEMARRRLDAQTPLETLRAAATAELVNDSTPDALREKLRSFMDRLHYGAPNLAGITACMAAYQGGAPWLDELIEYLAGNVSLVRSFLQERLPQLRLVEPEGTYLLWIDCRGLGLTEEGLADLLTNRARLWVNEGVMFGPGGEGFIRVNIACPRSVLREALNRLAEAVGN